MKSVIILFISILVFASSPKEYTLTAKVDNLRNAKGVVQFALYNKQGSLPDENFEKYYKKIVAKIDKNSSIVVFNKLPKGIYAINVLHDENSNGKIDKGFVLPVEGVGLSNYKSINLMNRPNFNDASFQLNSDKNKTVKINYF